ncbi:EpsG family protein [Paraburkholderia sp. BCC1885]|uniref:EpsG family protein n=1 Tax=Paraburkholderia sp. BCC1885 TaxID=2562669 RepID=UPI00164265F9|nr:EpsG family protein [Paraburkholderia sp. BCC1885]
MPLSLDTVRWTALYVVVGLLLAIVYASATVGVDSDKPAYELYYYYLAHNLGVPVGFDRVEPGFFGFTWLISRFVDTSYFYFFLIFAIEFFGLTCRLGKRSSLFRDRFYLSLLWLAFPFFYSLSINAVRQGLALVFVVYAIDAELTERKCRPFILLALGSLFHFSTAIYAPLFLLLRWRVNFRSLLTFWAICVVCAMLSIPQHLVELAALAAPDSFRQQFPYYFSYLTGTLTADYDTSFKFRFLLFSALPICAFAVTTRLKFAVDRDCKFLFKIYLILNGLFFLIGYIPFSDRIALLSWQLMPMLAVGLTPLSIRPVASIVAVLLAVAAFAYFFVF